MGSHAAGRGWSFVLRQQGKHEAEGRAFLRFGVQLQGAVMQLHGAVGEGEADSAAGLFGGEVQVENLVANLGRNSGAGVLHLQHGGL